MRLFFDKYFWPLILALLPLSNDIYEKVTQLDDEFVYSIKYKKNPVIEWNRQIGNFLKNLDEAQIKSDAASNYLLKKIGKELNAAIPVLLAEMEYRPMDSMEVIVGNITNYDLKNIKVSFIGCKGYDSFVSFPDQFSSLENANQISKNDLITIKYPSIPRASGRSFSLAYITFYGLDASECHPNIIAENNRGQILRARKVDDVSDYKRELAWDKYERDELFELLFKLLIGIALCYFYLQLRVLKSKLLP